MQTWGRQGAQKVAAHLVWGDRSEKISWRQDQFQGHTTSVSGSHTQKCSCLGFNAVWSPFDILDTVASPLTCVFCMKHKGAHAWGLASQPSAVPPAASLSPQEGFSAAHLRRWSQAAVSPAGRGLHTLPSPSVPSRDQAWEQGRSRLGLCSTVSWVGQDGICSQPGLAVP